jgi:hypothetical protein
MTKQPVMIGTINVSAVKLQLVDKALMSRGQAVGGTDQQKIVRLASWFAQNTPKTKIADCSTCGAESDVRLPECPFCGDGETEPEPAPSPVPATSGKVAADLPLFEGKTQALVRVAPGQPIVRQSPPEVVETPASEAALDEAVARIGGLMLSAADRLWELGAELVRVFDRALWTHRSNGFGEAKYKSWGEWCEAELGISHGYSLKLMDVAREFTREQVQKIGASKLHLTLQVPKGPARERLLGLAESGASRAQIAEATRAEVKLLPEPHTPDTGRGKKGGAGTHKDGPKGGRKPEKITVAMLLDRVEMHPQTAKGTKYRAKIPFPLVAEERMFNGVVQRIVVTNDEEGFLLVVVERVRE